MNPGKHGSHFILRLLRFVSNRNEQQLRIFERKILWKIFDPVQDENGIWRIRKNHELNELIGSEDSKIYKK